MLEHDSRKRIAAFLKDHVLCQARRRITGDNFLAQLYDPAKHFALTGQKGSPRLTGASPSLYVFQLARLDIEPRNASTVGKIFLTMMSIPCAVGCMPSAWLSLASAATPSRKNG